MRRILAVMLVGMIVAVPCGAFGASKGLNQADAEQLLRGNTAEGENRWKKNMTWYFDPGGVVHSRDQLGNKGKAQWSIDKKGQLCYQGKNDREVICGSIIPRGDGAYDVDIPGAWKWKKLTPGNPYNL